MVQFVGGARKFYLLQSMQTGSGPTQPPIQFILGTIPLGVKKLKCNANHSPPPSTKLKNEQTNTSTSPYTFIACTQITLHLPSRTVIRSILYFSATI
jgi:hypothetical protein